MINNSRVGKLLCVDDESGVLNALKRVLRDPGIEISTALSGGAALDIIKNTKIDVVLSDINMPEMTGIDLLQHIKTISPNTIRLILTAADDNDSIIDAINKGEIFRFINKPWDVDTLKTVIAHSFEHYFMIENIELLQNENSRINEDLAGNMLEFQQKSSEMQHMINVQRNVMDSLDVCLIYIDSISEQIFFNTKTKNNMNFKQDMTFSEFKKWLDPDVFERLINIISVDYIETREILKIGKINMAITSLGTTDRYLGYLLTEAGVGDI